MEVRELNREQLIQLKQHFYCSKHKSVSWGELVDIDSLVSDKKIFEEYENTCFCEEDFIGGIK